MELQSQKWFNELPQPSQRVLLDHLKGLYVTQPATVRQGKIEAFFQAISVHNPRALQWKLFPYTMRKDGLAAALAGKPYSVDLDKVGHPPELSALSRDQLITEAPPHTKLSELPRWAGGKCEDCNLALIDGLCVGLCVDKLPQCRMCNEPFHSDAACPIPPKSGYVTVPIPSGPRPSFMPPRYEAQKQIYSERTAPRTTYTYADQYNRRTKDEEKVRDSLFTKLIQGADDEKGANSRFNDSMALFAISSQQLVESNNKAWMMEVIQRIPEFDGSKPYEFLVWMDACERQAEDMRLPPLQVCRLRASGPVARTLAAMGPNHPWADVKMELRRNHSNVPTQSQAQMVLRNKFQDPKQELTNYLHEYGLHVKCARDCDPADEYDLIVKDCFLRSLHNRQLTRMVIKRLGPELGGSLDELFRKVQECKHELQYLDGITDSMAQVKAGEVKPIVGEVKAAAPTNPTPAQGPKTAPPGLVCYTCGENHFRRDCPIFQQAEKKLKEQRAKFFKTPTPGGGGGAGPAQTQPFKRDSNNNNNPAKVSTFHAPVKAEQNPGYQLAATLGQNLLPEHRADFLEIMAKDLQTRVDRMRNYANTKGGKGKSDGDGKAKGKDGKTPPKDGKSTPSAKKAETSESEQKPEECTPEGEEDPQQEMTPEETLEAKSCYYETLMEMANLYHEEAALVGLDYVAEAEGTA